MTNVLNALKMGLSISRCEFVICTKLQMKYSSEYMLAVQKNLLLRLRLQIWKLLIANGLHMMDRNQMKIKVLFFYEK